MKNYKDNPNKKTMILGLIFSILVVAYILVRVYLGNKSSRVIYQLDTYLLLSCFVIAIMFVRVVLDNISKKLHWFIKALAYTIYLGIVLFLVFLSIPFIYSIEKRVWSNEKYSVYYTQPDIFDIGYLSLYEKKGLSERRLFNLSESYYCPLNVSYTIYDSLNIVREDTEWDYTNESYFYKEKVTPYHTTQFYRLRSEEHNIDKTTTDSLHLYFETSKKQILP